MDSRRIITMDGPAGSGKSTVARIVARRLGLPCLNSGLIYRAVTLLALENQVDFKDEEKVAQLIRGMDLRFAEDESRTRVFVGARELTRHLKDPDVTRQVYQIANNGRYRSLLIDLQRRAAGPRGLVAEGRDMGTVIFPGAQHKFYIDAAPEERARRQQRDLEVAGHKKSYSSVLKELLDRDRRDRDRECSPLCAADGAVVISTDGLDIDQVVDKVLAHVGVSGDGPAAGSSPVSGNGPNPGNGRV